MKGGIHCENCGREIKDWQQGDDGRVVCKYGCKQKKHKLKVLKKNKEMRGSE